MSTMSTNNRKRKPRKPAPRKNTKVTGERSEAAFLNKAAGLGFGVAKPWGDSRRYDFILDNGSCLHRVQVKCTESIRARAYETRATFTTGKSRAAYTKKDIDFIAAHVVPLDIWYIIPVEICTPAPMLRFYPHRKAKRMRLESYREAWHHLQSPEDNDQEKIEIQACADETVYVADETVYVNDVPTNECHSERSGMIRPSESSPKSRNLLVRLPKSAAPWPIPLLRILTTRKGKQILRNPPPQ
jgi:hypothetical protein